MVTIGEGPAMSGSQGQELAQDLPPGSVLLQTQKEERAPQWKCGYFLRREVLLWGAPLQLCHFLWVPGWVLSSPSLSKSPGEEGPGEECMVAPMPSKAQHPPQLSSFCEVLGP